MVHKFITAFIISICLFLFAANTQSAFAEYRRYNTGFLHYFTTIILTRTTMTSETIAKPNSPTPIPSPTVFVAQNITPAPTTFADKATPTTSRLSPTPTKKPLLTNPSPTVPKIITATPSPAATTAPSTDAISFIMSEINKYRSSQGLSSVQTSAETCSFAATRAAEIVSSFNHDGFQNRINSKTLPYKTWSNVTENIAMTSNYKDVVNMWINSPGHAANMRSDTPFVCVRQSGNYFAYEGMRP